MRVFTSSDCSIFNFAASLCAAMKFILASLNLLFLQLNSPMWLIILRMTWANVSKSPKSYLLCPHKVSIINKMSWFHYKWVLTMVLNGYLTTFFCLSLPFYVESIPRQRNSQEILFFLIGLGEWYIPKHCANPKIITKCTFAEIQLGVSVQTRHSLPGILCKVHVLCDGIFCIINWKAKYNFEQSPRSNVSYILLTARTFFQFSHKVWTIIGKPLTSLTLLKLIRIYLIVSVCVIYLLLSIAQFKHILYIGQALSR